MGGGGGGRPSFQGRAAELGSEVVEQNLELGETSGEGRQKFEKPKSHTHVGFTSVSLTGPCWGVASEPSGGAWTFLLLHL